MSTADEEEAHGLDNESRMIFFGCHELFVLAPGDPRVRALRGDLDDSDPTRSIPAAPVRFAARPDCAAVLSPTHFLQRTVAALGYLSLLLCIVSSGMEFAGYEVDVRERCARRVPSLALTMGEDVLFAAYVICMVLFSALTLVILSRMFRHPWRFVRRYASVLAWERWTFPVTTVVASAAMLVDGHPYSLFLAIATVPIALFSEMGTVFIADNRSSLCVVLGVAVNYLRNWGIAKYRLADCDDLAIPGRENEDSIGKAVITALAQSASLVYFITVCRLDVVKLAGLDRPLALAPRDPIISEQPSRAQDRAGGLLWVSYSMHGFRILDAEGGARAPARALEEVPGDAAARQVPAGDDGAKRRGFFIAAAEPRWASPLFTVIAAAGTLMFVPSAVMQGLATVISANVAERCFDEPSTSFVLRRSLSFAGAGFLLVTSLALAISLSLRILRARELMLEFERSAKEDVAPLPGKWVHPATAMAHYTLFTIARRPALTASVVVLVLATSLFPGSVVIPVVPVATLILIPIMDLGTVLIPPENVGTTRTLRAMLLAALVTTVLSYLRLRIVVDNRCGHVRPSFVHFVADSVAIAWEAVWHVQIVSAIMNKVHCCQKPAVHFVPARGRAFFVDRGGARLCARADDDGTGEPQPDLPPRL